jgi:DNA polymerase III delta subunit
MRKLRPLMADDDGPGALLSLIERQARLMAAVKAQGPRPDLRALSTSLGVQSFALENAARAAARWNGNAVAEAIGHCARCDAAIKQGLMGDEAAVELLAMQVLALGSAKR